MGFLNWLRDSLAGPSPCIKRLPFEPDPPGPPTKPQPTGGRPIYVDRDPGPVNPPPPVPPRLPDDLTEMPSDQLMETWRRAAFAKYQANAKPTWHTTALLAIAWARQQQAQSLQLPPPGADPVATDEELLMVARSLVWFDEARRAVYNRGRADARASIAKALGMEP